MSQGWRDLTGRKRLEVEKQIRPKMLDFRLPPRIRRELRSSGLLAISYRRFGSGCFLPTLRKWLILSDVSGQQSQNVGKNLYHHSLRNNTEKRSYKTHPLFYVLLTVHLSVILVTDQLNAQTLVSQYVYYIPLHVSSTIVLIIRRSKLYYTASGIITSCR